MTPRLLISRLSALFQSLGSDRIRRSVLTGGVVLVFAVSGVSADSADSEFVGILAVAVQPDVVKELGLETETLSQLKEMIEKRKDQALTLALSTKNLAPDEAKAKLRAFAEESEEAGLELLAPQQQEQLRQIAVRDQGMQSLLDPAVAGHLQLTQTQITRLEEAWSATQETIRRRGEGARSTAERTFERNVSLMLSASQLDSWERLAGLSDDSPRAASEAASLAEDVVASESPAIASSQPPALRPLGLTALDEADQDELLDEEESGGDDLPEMQGLQDRDGLLGETDDWDFEAEDGELIDDGLEETEPASDDSRPIGDSPRVDPRDQSPQEATTPRDFGTDRPEVDRPSVAPQGRFGQGGFGQSGGRGSSRGGSRDFSPRGFGLDRFGGSGDTRGNSAPMREGDSSTTPRTPSAGALTDSSAGATQDDEPKSWEDIKIRFNFRYHPWRDVLDWFAEQADLSLVMDAPPSGTFNYIDGRLYSPTEALDVLNSVLLTKGYTLVRRGQMLMVVNLEDGVPETWVDTIAVEELPNRGAYELVRVMFDLRKMTPDEAEGEIRSLVGPQGAIVLFPKSQQILVTETAGQLRMIRDVIDGVENPSGGNLTTYNLEHLSAPEALPIIRNLMGMQDDENVSPDGSLRIATDTLGMRLFVTGKREAIQQFEEILKKIDTPDSDAAGGKPPEQLQIEVYNIGSADPTTTLQVMQTLLSGSPNIRLTIDEQTSSLIALCRPSEHATIRATLEQMKRDAKQVAVVHLQVVDPQVAVLSINRLYGATGENPAPNAPVVDADPLSRQLFVRGTAQQVSEVKEMLKQMGEDPDAIRAAQAGRGNIRNFALKGNAAERILQDLETLWPTVSNTNRIRVVRPGSTQGGNGIDLRDWKAPPTPQPTNQPIQDSTTRSARPNPQGEPRASQPLASPPIGQPVSFEAENTSENEGANADSANSVRSGDTYRKPSLPKALEAEHATSQISQSPPTTSSGSRLSADFPPIGSEVPPSSSGIGVQRGEIVIMAGSGGLMIASDDIEALNQIEELIELLSERHASSSAQFSVYYLKHAKAEVAATLLQGILTGASTTDDEGGSLLGDLASDMLGGGSLMGSLIGMGGGTGGGMALGMGTMSVIADPRLNALVVQAHPDDLDKIDQLLNVIDQPYSPEPVETKAKPRLIPLNYTSAQDVATVVQQVYADQIATPAAQRQQQQPSPEDFIRALRGGGGGGRGGRGGGGGNGAQSEPEKMTIGVDTRSNSLVVSAPDPMFESVKALVEQLDQAGDDNNQKLEIIRLRYSTPEAIQKALSSLTGGAVTRGTSTASTPTPGQPGGGGDRGAAEAARQQMEMFNRIRGSFQQGGGGMGGGPAMGRGGAMQGGGRGGPPQGGGRGGAPRGGGRGGR